MRDQQPHSAYPDDPPDAHLQSHTRILTHLSIVPLQKTRNELERFAPASVLLRLDRDSPPTLRRRRLCSGHSSRVGGDQSMLEASGQIVLLEPWYSNRTKSIFRSPKLYVADTGLLCALLNIRSVEALRKSPAAGEVWETTELAKWTLWWTRNVTFRPHASIGENFAPKTMDPGVWTRNSAPASADLSLSFHSVLFSQEGRSMFCGA